MYPFTFTIYAAPTWRWLTFTESDALASRVLDHQMRHELNKPKELTVILSNLDSGTRNYIDPTFNGWNDAATQPVAVGMEVRYDTIEMDTSTGSYSTKEETFYGVITELSQGPDQSLTIKARDFLERLEHITVSKTVFNSYHDQFPSDWALVSSAEAGSKLAIVISSAASARPMTKVMFATDDQYFDAATWDMGVTYSSGCLYGDMFCQSFIAPANGYYHFGVAYRILAGSWLNVNGHCIIHLYKDNGANRPDIGNEICHCDVMCDYYTNPTPVYDTPVQYSDEIQPLVEGEKYWITFENHNNIDSGAQLNVVYDPAGTYKSDTNAAHCYNRAVAGTYTEIDGNMLVRLWMVQFNECDPDSYHYENISGTEYLILDKSPGQWSGDIVPLHTATFPADLKRGMLSYYYGTKQVHEVMDTIIPLDYEYFKNSYNRSVSTSIDLAINLFRTKGKTLGACMRELCDLLAYSSTGQCSMAVFRPHGETYQQLKVGYRTNTGDAAAYSFGPGNFVEGVEAVQTSTNRPCRIVVIGKTTSAGTITATVEDDDWKTQSKFTVTETIQDDSIQTIADAFARARGTLEGYKRGVWEGSMRLAGVFPQLMHDHYLASVAQWGDGAIIAVTWPDLGWSSLKLKVTGTTIGPDYTDVRFSNADALRNNIFINNIQSQQRSESFISPTDSQNILYLPLYTTAAGWSWGTYIDLCTAPTTPITNYKIVKGTSFDTTNPVRRVWHFEIDAKNGYTVDGTPINQLDFYPDYSKSVKIWTIDFASSLSASYNFYKWKTTKVIVDLVINPS